MRADLEGVHVAEPAGGRGGERGGAAFSVDQGAGNRRPMIPNRSEITTEIFSSVLEDLFDPVLVADLVLGQPGPGPGQRPQIPDALRWHERAAQHPPLVQLAQPHAVFPVASAPAGQAPAGARAAHPRTPTRDRPHQALNTRFRGHLTPQGPLTKLS